MYGCGVGEADKDGAGREKTADLGRSTATAPPASSDGKGIREDIANEGLNKRRDRVRAKTKGKSAKRRRVS